jgi:predicted nucleic acid-binding protein
MDSTDLRVAVDANLVVALVLPLPYSAQARIKMVSWQRAATELLAPWLLEYEVSAVLRRAVVAGLLSPETARQAMRGILDLRIQCLPPTPELHGRALWWVEQLGQTKTYDAHYLALAEQQQVALWTADRRLVDAAGQVGATWLRWIGEAGSP